MKKLTAAQQKVIDSIKASAAKFAGKTYEEAYPRVEDRDRWTKRVYENAQKGRYLVEAHPNTIAALVKAGIIDREGNSLFYWLVEDKKEEETMNTKYEMMTKQAQETLKADGKVTFVYETGEQKTVTTESDIKTAIQLAMIGATEDITGMFPIETKLTKAEAIEAMDDDAEDPSVTLDEFIAKAQEIDNMKEDEPMTAQIGDKVKIGATTYTIAEIFYAQLFQSRFPAPDDGWMIEFKDTNGGYHYWKQYLDGGEFIKATADNNTTTNNEEEETTMKTTNTVTIDLTEGVAKFELDGTTYKYMIDSKRYAKTTPDGKTKRIGKAEYDEAKATYDNAWATYEQEKLDKDPCRVEVENDLDKPAVLDEYGCVDCRKCNCDKCVHRNCMRRNPRNVGGLGECPRLDNGIVSEAQKMAEETGMELAEAELAVNVQNEQKKPRKARKSKDIAYEGNGVTLTAKQVDFLGHLSDTCFWENGADSTAWIDVLCDEIGGQFEGKPMTVGAMVSTLCEKGLGYRAVDRIVDPRVVTGKGHKSTYFGLTELGQKIYAELGLE